MAQPSIANYFNTRKRGAAEELKVNSARKVLLLDETSGVRSITPKPHIIQASHEEELKTSKPRINLITEAPRNSNATPPRRRKIAPKPKKMKTGNIEELFNNLTKTNVVDVAEPLNNFKNIEPTTPTKTKPVPDHVTPTKHTEPQNVRSIPDPITPTRSVKDSPAPITPTKENAMDKVTKEPNLAQLKQKLSRSSRLAELRASIARFRQSEESLKVAEKKTEQLKDSPSLKNFKRLEVEVNLSPSKAVQSPQKAYLSPKKDTSVKKNLFNLQSPTKNAMSMPTISKELTTKETSLTLPYKYRCLAEIFRAIETVSQILFNRKETITFRKLKPAVEEMLKRNVADRHLGQIKSLYPEAFTLQWEKLREFGTGRRQEQWELVVTPDLEGLVMTSELLLGRRRKFYKILIDKLKIYHKEFLSTLDPPLEIPDAKITRWHPLFDIEKVPDVETCLPPAPNDEKLLTGSQVLEKAREMFSCNTRMERALERLKESQTQPMKIEEVKQGSVLKGIPKALLEKVRLKQAAKALESMTRSSDKEKEVQLYTQLPEVARLTRNLFVSEKKSVLPLELAVEKLCNSSRAFYKKDEMEKYLRTISKEIKDWLVFHEFRGVTFIKLLKNADLSIVMNKLQKLVEEKQALC